MSALKGIIQNRIWLPEDEPSLRAECAIACPEGTPPEITRIAVVGGLDLDFSNPFSRDAMLLGMLLSYLGYSGIPVSPDFTADCVNLRDGRDFLREQKKYDLVFIPRILARGTPERFTHDVRFPRMSLLPSDLRDPFANAVSPLDTPERWQRRCRMAGAKMIVTFGGAQDVGPKTFAGAFYQTLVAAPPLELDQMTACMPARVFFRQPVDFPFSWIGISAEKNWLDTMRSKTSGPRTTLAKVIAGRLDGPALSAQPGQGPLLGPVIAALSRLPALGAMFKLKGNHISLDGAQGKDAYAKRDHGPQHGMHP